MSEPTVFVDLDGVLANFVKGATDAHGLGIPHDRVVWGFDRQSGIDPAAFWARFDRSFWAGLEPYADGLALLLAVERRVGFDRVFLLSSPCKTEGCMEGKLDWVKQHLPGYERKFFLGSAKHAFAGPNKFLLDDYDKNVSEWATHGGVALRVPRPWNVGSDRCLPGGLFNPYDVIKDLESRL